MKQFKAVLTLFVCLLYLSALAQPNYEWNINLNGTGGIWGNFNGLPIYSSNDRAKEIGLDSFENIYLSGWKYGATDYDPSQDSLISVAGEGNDFFVAKYDTCRQLHWGLSLNLNTPQVSNRHIEVAPGGDFYIAVEFKDTVNLNPLGDTVLMVGDTLFDVLIAKYDNNGLLIWAYPIHSSENLTIKDLAFDRQGNLLITGNLVDLVDFDPGPNEMIIGALDNYGAYLAKFSNDGQLVWANAFPSIPNSTGTIGSVPTCLATDQNNNIFLAGEGRGSSDYDPSPSDYILPSANNSLVGMLLKYDEDGNFLWGKEVNGTNQTHFRSMAIDNNDHIILTGMQSGTTDYNTNGLGGEFTANGGVDIVVIKYDAGGNYLWAHSFGFSGDDYAEYLTVDAAGDIYMTGNFGGTVDVDPSAEEYLLSANSKSVYVIKYSAGGELLWGFDISANNNSPAGSFQIGSAISISENSIYLAGGFVGTCDFDPSDCEAIFTSVESINHGDAFLAKYTKNCSPPDLPDLSLSASPVCEGDIVTIMVSETSKLRNANAWFLYENDCSGIAIDTSVTGIFFVNPSVSTTYFVRGEGCCFEPGACAAIDLEVQFLVYTELQDQPLCEGDSLFFANGFIDEPGIYTDTLSGYQGCDSIVELIVFEIPVYTDFQYQLLCEGDSLFFANGFIDEPGIYTDTLSGYQGCDSIVELTVAEVMINTIVTVADSTLIALEENAEYQWYNCQTETIVEGAIFQEITPLVSGSYAVFITQNGCTQLSDCVAILVTSTGLESDASVPPMISLLPNPISAFLKLEISKPYNPLHFQLFDLKGVLLFEAFYEGQENIIVNTEKLNTGLYFLKVQQEARIEVFKILKI